mgnify:CR=1 FL=1
MKSGTILLVEDSDDDVMLTRRAFRKASIHNPLDVVPDGEAALDYLFARGAHGDRADQDPPCLVLLDLQLPKVSGLEVLRQIRANPATSLLPVVILTSSKEEQDLVEGYRLGANSYIRKPVDLEQFQEAVPGALWVQVEPDLGAAAGVVSGATAPGSGPARQGRSRSWLASSAITSTPESR